MHASSNFVVLLKGEPEEFVPFQEYLQDVVDIDILKDNRFLVEETYEAVWVEDIIELFVNAISLSPNIELVVVGYVDCTENSGEVMDFALIYKDFKLKAYTSDWKYASYDDENNEFYDIFGLYAYDELDEELDFNEIISEIDILDWCDKDSYSIKPF